MVGIREVEMKHDAYTKPLTRARKDYRCQPLCTIPISFVSVSSVIANRNGIILDLTDWFAGPKVSIWFAQ
jgi:hypothetical protein